MKIHELVDILNHASYTYYQENRQTMSDFEYDKLYEQLEELEKETGIVLSNSPTRNVGYTVLSALTKVPHEVPLLSLDKTKDQEKLKTFLDDKTGILSWKMDGLTVVLEYNNGALTRALTRGNGEIGEDITHNAHVFKNIPVSIPFAGELLIRGEAVISFADFEEINTDGQYKNPRNLCSGTVRQLNNEVAAKRNVQFIAFSVVKAEGESFADSKAEQLKWLKSLGFGLLEFKEVSRHNLYEELDAFRQSVEGLEFATDGLVLTYDSIAYSESLGATSKFPKDSIAFKWADEIAHTTLLEVQWNTSRTGLINPVAIFKPVELEGTTVHKASLHNISVMEHLELGIGDSITVYKANMIIPQVAENLTKSANIKIPLCCNVCQGPTEITAQNEVKALYCINPNCKAQLVRSLSHFSSRNAMNIEGFSVATIERFVEKNWLLNYTDIYRLFEKRDEIKELSGFGERSCQKLLDAIENSKKRPLASFIYALGIHHVGLSNAKSLCRHFNNDIKSIIKAEAEELIEIEKFGEVIAHSLCGYFKNKDNIRLLNAALPQLTLTGQQAASGVLEGKSFVITGELAHFTNRKQLQDYIETRGGKVTASVTGKTSFLINNNPHSSTGKNKKAKELGVPILSEEEFLQL